MSFSIYVLQVVAFVDLLAVGLIVPLVSGHVRNLGGSHLYVGLLGSIYAGFQLVSGPIIGSLSDLKGRKTIMILTQLVCAVAYTVLGLTNSILIILLMRAVLGLFKQTQMLSKALVPDYEKDEKKQGDIYGKMAAISGAGITLGPIIGGHIAEDNPENGFLLIAIVVGIFFAINSSIVYFLPNCDKQKKQSKTNSKAKVVPKSVLQSAYGSIRQSIVELYYIEWSIYWDIFLFKALIGFAMGVYYSNYSLYLKTIYDLSPKYIGYVIAFQGVIGSICSFFIGYINNFYVHDKDYSIRNFHVFLVISISLFGLLTSFNVLMYTLWLIPLAISNAVGRLVTLEMVLKRSRGDHRGTLIGASNSMRSLTGVVSPMVSGFIGEYYGLSYVIYASLFSTLIGVILSYRNKIKLKVE